MSVQEYYCKEHGTFGETFSFDDPIPASIECFRQKDGHLADWRPSIPQIIVKDGTGAGARKFRKN